jgi:hypothetical protein
VADDRADLFVSGVPVLQSAGGTAGSQERTRLRVSAQESVHLRTQADIVAAGAMQVSVTLGSDSLLSGLMKDVLWARSRHELGQQRVQERFGIGVAFTEDQVAGS